MTCSLCGEPIIGAWMTMPDAKGNADNFHADNFHADTGIYGPLSYLSCAMVVAQNVFLTSKGWKHPPGCVTYHDR